MTECNKCNTLHAEIGRLRRLHKSAHDDAMEVMDQRDKARADAEWLKKELDEARDTADARFHAAQVEVEKARAEVKRLLGVVEMAARDGMPYHVRDEARAVLASLHRS